jgi:hypothetical protein
MRTNFSLRQTSVLLARLAAKATGAETYSLSRTVDEKPRGCSFARYPIRVDEVRLATLEFTFREDPIPEEKLALLDQMAGAIEAVEALPHSAATRAARAASLDVELAEIKIAERAQGLLAAHTAAEEGVREIVRHVQHVLDRRQLDVFGQLLPELEERVAERKLLVRAKSLLRDRDGLSEEQAYLLLRNRSRSSRKRLREVAQETISQSYQPLSEEQQGGGL